MWREESAMDEFAESDHGWSLQRAITRHGDLFASGASGGFW
jgi:hypothetical protein